MEWRYEIFSFTKPTCAIYLVVGKIHPSTQHSDNNAAPPQTRNTVAPLFICLVIYL